METVWSQGILGVIGFASGFIVAGGVVALMVGLGIITRFIGISHTAGRVMLYEDGILLGTIVGTILTTFQVALPKAVTAPELLGASLPLGTLALAAGGLFMGVFVGGWIMALAEVINVFPVYCRRLGITKGLSLIIIVMAVGKVLGSLMIFYMRWGKG